MIDSIGLTPVAVGKALRYVGIVGLVTTSGRPAAAARPETAQPVRGRGHLGQRGADLDRGWRRGGRPSPRWQRPRL